jgi:ABC-type branched-subunit amino acid transport system substrate-binding protein
MTSEAMMAEFDAEEIKMIIGPVGSQAANWARDYADGHGQTLLSCAATAVSLGVAGDSLFRFAIPDTFQGQALVREMANSGITQLAIFVQSDIYGSGLSAEITRAFEDNGGNVFQIYDMRGASTVDDMTYILDQLSSDLVPVLESVDESQVAIAVIMYEQAVTLLEVANDYDTLHRLSWFGTDSLALNSKLVNNAMAASFAVRTDFRCPIMAEFPNEAYQSLKEEISAVTGSIPSVYEILHHDAVMVVCDAMQNAGDQSPENLRPALREAAGNFDGATSPILLDANDDRIAESNQMYDFWKVVADGARFTWVLDSSH